MAALEGRTLGDTTFYEPLHRLHWGGILAGVLTGLVVYLVLGAFGVAIGLGSAANLSDIKGLSGIGIGSAIWLLISLGGASVLAGLVSARASTDLNLARGRFNGLMTGIAICAVLTIATAGGLSNLASSLGSAAGGAVSSAVSATSMGVSGAVAAGNNSGGIEGLANRLGLGDELQTLQNGLNRQEISQIIADGSPELNQAQVDAAAITIESIINNAARNLSASLTDVSSIGNVVSKQADAISQALQGDQFTTRLQRRGLSKTQAQEVVKVVSARVTELRQQAQQTAQAIQDQAAASAKQAAAALANAIWIWLFAVGVTLAAATFGGNMGATDKSVVKASAV